MKYLPNLGCRHKSPERHRAGHPLPAEHGPECAISVITRAEVLTAFDDAHAALARHPTLTLVTRNARDFSGVPGLDVAVPYTV